MTSRYQDESMADNPRFWNLIDGINYGMGTLAADFSMRQKLVPKYGKCLNLYFGGNDIMTMSKSNIDMHEMFCIFLWATWTLIFE